MKTAKEKAEAIVKALVEELSGCRTRAEVDAVFVQLNVSIRNAIQGTVGEALYRQMLSNESAIVHMARTITGRLETAPVVVPYCSEEALGTTDEWTVRYELSTCARCRVLVADKQLADERTIGEHLHIG